jgi:hypothetical protein
VIGPSCEEWLFSHTSGTASELINRHLRTRAGESRWAILSHRDHFLEHLSLSGWERLRIQMLQRLPLLREQCAGRSYDEALFSSSGICSRDASISSAASQDWCDPNRPAFYSGVVGADDAAMPSPKLPE